LWHPSNMARVLTRDQLQSRKEQAVRFVRDVLGDPERAGEIADERLDDYAERRKIQIANPAKRRMAIMARGKTKAQLEAEIEELQAENQELQDQLDAVADIVNPDEDDDEEDVPDDDDQGDDDDEEDDTQDLPVPGTAGGGGVAQKPPTRSTGSEESANTKPVPPAARKQT